MMWWINFLREQNNHRKHIPNKVDKTIFMYPIRFLEFQKAVTSLKDGFSIGCYGMLTSLFKENGFKYFLSHFYLFLALA